MTKFAFVLLLFFTNLVYAEKPLVIVVGFSAGGSADTTARILAKGLTKKLNKQVVVENKVGAGGLIAYKHIMESEPDGNTILLTPVLQFKEFAPVSTVVTFPHILAVSSSLNVKTLKEFLELGKTRQLSYASTGVNSIPQMQGEELSRRSKIDMIHVPYKGGSSSVIDVIENRVDFFFAGMTVVEQHIKTGKLIALGVSTAERSKFLPQIPTISEQGFDGFDMPNSYVVIANEKTDKNILEKLNFEINSVLKDKSVIEDFNKLGFTTTPMSRKATKKFIDKNLAIYRL